MIIPFSDLEASEYSWDRCMTLCSSHTAFQSRRPLATLFEMTRVSLKKTNDNFKHNALNTSVVKIQLLYSLPEGLYHAVAPDPDGGGLASWGGGCSWSEVGRLCPVLSMF